MFRHIIKISPSLRERDCDGQSFSGSKRHFLMFWLQEDEEMKRLIKILMTLLLRNHPPKVNWYDLKLVCLFEFYSSCFDAFQILYIHVLFLTFIFMILAK